jgi:hypothetical protein
MVVIASATSEAAPLKGQDNRSGPNFQLVSNDESNITLTVLGETAAAFKIMRDKTVFKDPTIIAQAQNGTTVGGGVLEVGKDYYIANPVNATTAFTVEFTQN